MHLFVDIMGVKFIPMDWKVLWDVIYYNNLCTSFTWKANAVYLKLYGAWDFDECVFGLGGIFTN